MNAYATMTSFEQITEVALQLTPLEKTRLIEQLAATLGQDLTMESVARHTLYGICNDAPILSLDEEMDIAYLELWEDDHLGEL